MTLRTVVIGYELSRDVMISQNECCMSNLGIRRREFGCEWLEIL